MTGWIWRLADAVRHRVRVRTEAPNQASGRRGEDLAHRYLEERGFIVVARNWRAAGGEIDLIAWDRESLVFVEVKARASDEISAPERNIDRMKQRALYRAAREYARRAGVGQEAIRFDTVSVILSEPARIQHQPGALDSGRRL